MESTEFLIVGCGPAGGIAAREAARAGVSTVVLERDPVVGAKRVCAAGLRPGFCENFDLPRDIVHCDPPTIACSTANGTYSFAIGTAHTTTREELDGSIAALARVEGADIRTSTLFRSLQRDGDGIAVEYADYGSGTRRTIRAKHVFLAQGSSARLDAIDPRFGYNGWNAGLITCFQYRVYLEQPAIPITYQTLEMHYYVGTTGRNVIGWMFPNAITSRSASASRPRFRVRSCALNSMRFCRPSRRGSFRASATPCVKRATSSTVVRRGR